MFLQVYLKLSYPPFLSLTTASSNIRLAVDIYISIASFFSLSENGTDSGFLEKLNNIGPACQISSFFPLILSVQESFFFSLYQMNVFDLCQHYPVLRLFRTVKTAGIFFKYKCWEGE